MIDRAAERLQNHYIQQRIRQGTATERSNSNIVFEPLIQSGLKGIPKALNDLKKEIEDDDPFDEHLTLSTALNLIMGTADFTLISMGFKSGNDGKWGNNTEEFFEG